MSDADLIKALERIVATNIGQPVGAGDGDTWIVRDGVARELQAIAQDALSAHRAAPVAGEVEGWQLVPKEPSDAMISAGSEALAVFARAHPDHTSFYAGNADKAYRAMLAAAPTLQGKAGTEGQSEPLAAALDALAGMLDSFGGYVTPEVDAAITVMQAHGRDRWSMQAQMDADTSWLPDDVSPPSTQEVEDEAWLADFLLTWKKDPAGSATPNTRDHAHAYNARIDRLLARPKGGPNAK